ncbi:MAG TPA: CoA-binding protein [Gammaproteobacteria bacterium]|nr:CoA-binding protein [Gammaproteobacteria bacterium]
MTVIERDDATLRRLFETTRTIAVVGLSPKPNRPSHQVARYMQQAGYRILPVRPAVESILGEPAYPSLADLPEVPDLVDVFRAPEHVPEVVDACIALGVPALWLQEGVVHEEAAARAQAAGLTVVMDLCLLKEHARLC